MSYTEHKHITLTLLAGRGMPNQYIDVEVGMPCPEMPTPKNRDRVFQGWFTAPNSGDLIEKGTEIEFGTDVLLYARWKRKTGEEKKKSMLRTQKRAIAISLAVVVLLAIAYPIVSHFLSIYTFTDLDGTEYKVKKNDGVYMLYDGEGNVTETTNDGYYITALSTLVKVDGDTGDASVYAKVDTEGNEVVGANDRVLMFPHVSQSGVLTIKVTNSYGTYTFHSDTATALDSSGNPTLKQNVYIEGYSEDDNNGLVTYDPEKYAYLCVATGYTLSMKKLVTADLARDENGNIDYAVYGLTSETRTDKDGKEYTYTPATYTITDKSKTSYTVTVGDCIRTGAGYYAKYEGRDAIYIIGTDVATTVLSPIEDLIKPMIVYPMTMNNYFNVQGFVLIQNDYTKFDQTGKEDDVVMTPLAGFSYIPLTDRENTMNSSDSFKTTLNYLDVYKANMDNISAVLQNFYSMEFLGVKKLGYYKMTQAELEEYGLYKPEYFIRYNYVVSSAIDGATATGTYDKHSAELIGITLTSDYDKTYVQSFDLLTGICTIAGQEKPITYKVTSTEGTGGSMVFTLAYRVPDDVKEGDELPGGDTDYDIIFTVGADKKITCTTTYYLEQTLSISSRTESGSYYVGSDYCNQVVEIDEQYLNFVEWETIDWVENDFFNINIAYVTNIDFATPNGKVNFTLDNSASDKSKTGSDKLVVYANGKKLEYSVFLTSVTGKVTEKDAVYNFRQFFKAMLYSSIEGMANLTAEEKAAFKAMDDSACQLVITVKAHDDHYVCDECHHAFNNEDCYRCSCGYVYLASEHNGVAFADLNEKTYACPLCKGGKSNFTCVGYAGTTDYVCPYCNKVTNFSCTTQDLVIRFYKYSERRSFMTINGQGEFYVLSSFVDKLIADSDRVVKGELIDATGKY